MLQYPAESEVPLAMHEVWPRMAAVNREGAQAVPEMQDPILEPAQEAALVVLRRGRAKPHLPLRCPMQSEHRGL